MYKWKSYDKLCCFGLEQHNLKKKTYQNLTKQFYIFIQLLPTSLFSITFEWQFSLKELF